MIDVYAERQRHHAGGDLSAGGWEEFTAARGRFFAHLAAQSAAWRAARRLPTQPDERYDRAPADEGDEARPQ